MRRVCTVMFYTVLRNVRDVSSTTEMILVPLAMVFILGTALDGAFQPRGMEAVPIAVVTASVSSPGQGSRPGSDANADANAEAEKARFLRFLQRSAGRELVSIVPAVDREEAVAHLAARRVAAAVVFGAARDRSVEGRPREGDSMDGDPELPIPERSDTATTVTTVMQHPNEEMEGAIVRSLVEDYLRTAAVTEVVAHAGDADDVETLDARESRRPSWVEHRSITPSGAAPRAIDFYAVSMLVLTVMYVASYAAEAVRDELLNPIGERVRATPIAQWQHMAGKYGAHILTGMVQAAILIAATIILFQASWGDHPATVAALLIAMALFASAVGSLIPALMRDGTKALTAVNILVVASMVLSGGAIRFSAGPSFQAFQRLLPHYHGQRALLNLVHGGATEAVTAAFVYFLGGALLASILTMWVVRRSA